MSPRESSRRGGRPGSSRPKGRQEPRKPPVVDAARQAALDTLRAVSEHDAYANLVLPNLLRQRRLSGQDAALATELAYGACRARGLLDAVIAACVDRNLSKVDSELLDVLRLGTYQLLRTRIPPHAAVSSTVNLARTASGAHTAGFVNAVLRKVSQDDEPGWIAKLAPDPSADAIGYQALAHAHPRWVAQAFATSLGSTGDELAAALRADNERPAVHLLAKPGEITADELAAITGGDPAPYSPYGVRLEVGAGDPGELAPVRERLAAVQDEGSQLCALALSKAPLLGADSSWLDLCAGPGGKAALLGALVGLSGGVLDAVEPAPHRAKLVRQICDGLAVRVHEVDGRDPDLAEASYDRVLVDAPCTGLGALRRRPEARWRRRPDDVASLAKLQRELLLSALRLARPGGVVAYVVCSPHVSETIGVVDDVLRRGGAIQLDARDYFPGVPELDDALSVQLWPHRHGTDAMYCALLRREP